MTTEIKDTKIEGLFNLVRSAYQKHGSILLDNWQDWPRLNKFYKSEMHGNFIKQYDGGSPVEFVNQFGSHPIFDSRVPGDPDDDATAFDELRSVLVLEMTEHVNGVRYWKINNPDFA